MYVRMRVMDLDLDPKNLTVEQCGALRDWLERATPRSLLTTQPLQDSLGNKLRLLIDHGLRDLLGRKLVLRRNREVLLLDLRRGGASAVLADRLLSLGGVLLGEALDSLGSVTSVLVGEALELGGLLVGNVVTLLELSVNDLLVLEVDKRTKVGDDGCNQGQSPERNELDEEVRDQGSKEGLERRISERSCSRDERNPNRSSGGHYTLERWLAVWIV
jgi:hypothetical protein